MTARYVLRLDDACHTMNSQKWQLLESFLDDFGIKPLVAVVPDNEDPELKYAPSNAMFWDQVRLWQAKGWTIAMHGYRHVMHHTKAKLILPFYERSEFAGLTHEEQSEKVRRSWEIFISQGVEPTVWVAPAHCFDVHTLKAIRAETPIRIVSDGIARDHYFENDFHWVPQQLWKLTEKKGGLWTVCLHPSNMSEAQIESLREAVAGRFSSRIIAFEDVSLWPRKKSLPDRVEEAYFWQRHRVSQTIRKAREIVRG